MSSIIRKTINFALAGFGYRVDRLPSPDAVAAPIWDNDAEFNDLMSRVAERTIVSRKRCYMLYQMARQASAIPGDAAEVGVYKGGTARLLAKSLEARRESVHLFDTFSGMPETDPVNDTHKEGDFPDTSLEAVKSYLSDCGNVHFHQGTFPTTAKPIESKSFCLVHIDADIYRSVMACCEFFYPRMSAGGIMIFDDYGFPTCKGARQSVDDFFMDRPESPCYLPTGQCFMTKHQ